MGQLGRGPLAKRLLPFFNGPSCGASSKSIRSAPLTFTWLAAMEENFSAKAYRALASAPPFNQSLGPWKDFPARRGLGHR